jgi:hypothetical protein
MLRTVALISLFFVAGTVSAGQPCKISSDRLISLAREAVGNRCEAPRACRFAVLEKERASHCVVVITPVTRNEFGLEQAPMPGSFEIVEFSNAGKVLKRQGGA